MTRKEVLSRWYEKAKKEGRLWQQKNPEKYSAYQKKYRKEHSDKLKRYGKDYYTGRLSHYRDLRQELKREVLKVYGGVCSCCGENRIEFLTIDHVNNDGEELLFITGYVGITILLDLGYSVLIVIVLMGFMAIAQQLIVKVFGKIVVREHEKEKNFGPLMV